MFPGGRHSVMKSPGLLPALALSWAVLCLGLFLAPILPTLGAGLERAAWFWKTSPGDGGNLSTVFPAHARSAGTALLICLAGLSLGKYFLAWARAARHGNPPIELVAGLVLILPPLIFGLGLAGLFRIPALVLVLAIPAITAIPRLRPPKISSPGPGWVLAGAVLLAPSFLCALVPEIQYDALQYHLALPRRFLEAGRIYLADPWPHTNFHLAIEMLFVPAMAMGGDGAAKLLNWQFFPLLLVLTRTATLSAGATGISAHLPWLVLAASPLFSQVAGQTFTDCGAACAVTGAILLRLGPRPPAFAIGALVGAAGSVKIPSLAYGLALLPFLAPRGRILPALAGWSLPVVAWPMKSFLLTGSPFGGIALTGIWPAFLQGETIIDFLRSGNWTAPGHHSVWLTLPLTLLKNLVAEGFELSPFLTVLLPLALLPAPGRASFLRRSLIASFALWPFTGGGQIRFLAPFIPLALVTATAGDRLEGLAPRRLLRLGAVFISLLGLYRTCSFLYLTANPVSTVLGRETPRAYLARIITPAPFYMEAAGLAGRLPRLGRTYMAGDIKSYYWPRRPRNDSQFLNPLLLRWARDSRSPRDMAAKFRQAGLGSVASNLGGSITMSELSGGYRWTGRSLEILQKFWASHMALVREMGNGSAGWIYLWEFDYGGNIRFDPAKSHWLQIPCTGALTMEADIALDQGRLDEAGRGYRELAKKWPRFAVIPLRLAELARLRGDTVEMRRQEREASRLMGAAK
jgi:hypothetical protein